jgi:hypothetical protein
MTIDTMMRVDSYAEGMRRPIMKATPKSEPEKKEPHPSA